MLVNSFKEKGLFDLVENYKQNNRPVCGAFREYAKNNNLNEFSVRNLYYNKLKELEKNQDLCNCFGVDLTKHKKIKPTHFSSREKLVLIKNIDNMVANGYSVRKACLSLAGGDMDKMTRFQNKYRNEKEPNNIIKMPTKKAYMSEAEIESLFMGLVRLVKKTAVIEAKESIKSSIEQSQALLDKYFYDISKKDEELKNLKQSFVLLKQDNNQLKQQIICLKAKNTANQKIKKYFNKNCDLTNKTSQKIKI